MESTDCVYAQVDCAKQLEKTKREMVCKVEKDKSTLSARDEELDAANNALEGAQKRVWAAQKAKRQQAFAAQAHEVLLRPHQLYSVCTTLMHLCLLIVQCCCCFFPVRTK